MLVSCLLYTFTQFFPHTYRIFLNFLLNLILFVSPLALTLLLNYTYYYPRLMQDKHTRVFREAVLSLLQ
jgi:hypothetical protein